MHVTVVIFRNGKAIHKLIHWLTFSTTPGLLTLVPIAERERRPEQALEEKLRENAASTAVSPRSVEPLISLPVFSLSQGKRPSSAGEQVVVLDNLSTGFDWAVLPGAKLGDRRCRRSIMRRRADRAASGRRLQKSQFWQNEAKIINFFNEPFTGPSFPFARVGARSD